MESLVVDAEGPRRPAQAEAGAEQFGGLLAEGGVLEGGVADRAGGRGRAVLAVASRREGAGDGAPAETVGAGQMGDRGEAEVGEHGEGDIAGQRVVGGVGVDGIEVQEIDEGSVPGEHGEGVVNGDGIGGLERERGRAGKRCGTASHQSGS